MVTTAERTWGPLLEALGHAIVLLDGERRILAANAAAAALFGFAAESVAGSALADCRLARRFPLLERRLAQDAPAEFTLMAGPLQIGVRVAPFAAGILVEATDRSAEAALRQQAEKGRQLEQEMQSTREELGCMRELLDTEQREMRGRGVADAAEQERIWIDNLELLSVNQELERELARWRATPQSSSRAQKAGK